MSLGGLIASALGGGARGYTEAARGELKNQQELNLRALLAEVEKDKQLAIDAIRRERDIADIGTRADAETAANTRNAVPRAVSAANAAVAGQVAGLNAASAANLPQLQAAADQAKYDASKPLAERQARDKVTLDTQLTIDQVKTPGFLDAIKEKAKAGHIESSGSLAQAALANYKLGQERSLGTLRDQLSKTTDEVKRAELTQRINDLSGSTSGRSFGDVVAMANGYVSMAGKLRTAAKDELDPGEKQRLTDQAAQFEAAADQVFGAVRERRLGDPGSSKPAAGGGAARGGAPKTGDTRTVQTGPHKGKTAVWDGNGWKLQGQ